MKAGNNKILIFSTAYFPFMSGAEMAVDEIAKRNDDFEFDLITARMDRKLTKQDRHNNINIYRVGFGLKTIDKFLLPFWGYLKAKKLYFKNNYKIVWSLMASQGSIGASFLKIKFPQTKLLLTLQEGDEEEYLKRYVLGINWLYKLLIRPWYLLVFKKASYVTVISEYLKKRAQKNGFKGEIAIVPNAVDLEKFSQELLPEELDEVKRELNKKPAEKYLIHTGRLNYKNALDDVIKVLPQISANVKFLLIGSGEELKKLKSLSKKLKVENRVIFKKFVPHEQMVKYLKVADIFIRPSLSEGLGSSFLEAMAAEVLVIATPVGGIPDFLEDGKTGWFCKVRAPQSIAEKIKYVLDEKNKAEVNKVIDRARQMVEEKYNWDKIAKDMKGVFNKL